MKRDKMTMAQISTCILRGSRSLETLVKLLPLTTANKKKKIKINKNKIKSKIIAESGCTYNDKKGVNYLGQQAVTENGYTCGSWILQTAYPAAHFPDDDLEKAVSREVFGIVRMRLLVFFSAVLEWKFEFIGLICVQFKILNIKTMLSSCTGIPLLFCFQRKKLGFVDTPWQ